jgi:peptidoglycan biosynthesis protein MviN/MurJ (putative lipid II flippase)
VLSRRIGPVGVALSSALSITGYTALLSWWWHRKFGGETFAGLGKVFVKIGLVSAVSAVPAYFALGADRLFTAIHPHLGALMAIGASGVCFALFFAVLSARFCPEYVEPYLLKAGRPGATILRIFRPRIGGA